MTTDETPQPTNQQDIGRKLHLLMDRFSRGLSLSREDLAVVGWLYFYEQETGSQGIPDSEIRWLISQAVKVLGLEDQSFQPSQLIQRLMRFGILRITIIDGRRRGYRLTCLGQSMARTLVDEIDYSFEQLNVLLSFALKQVRAAGAESKEALLNVLRHIFLGIIREKIEYKLLAIEEDLDGRKQKVRTAYSGQNQADFEGAIRDIEYCRMALTELVDAVQESSACVNLEEELHEYMGRKPGPDLYEVLEQSLNFIYILRTQVDTMLRDVVQFIHDCIACRSLAFTVDFRDRLRRVQEQILSHALEHVVRMPVLDVPRLPRLDLNWSKQEREHPVFLDRISLKTLEDFRLSEIPSVEPEWKESFLELAREEWKRSSGKRGICLGDWLTKLAETLPELNEAPYLALWFLTQDWPNWTPKVMTEHQRGEWVPLGEEWMMEAIHLVPVTRRVLNQRKNSGKM